jgi:drug/metabolite transporter (DMT)-like permease
MTRHVAVAALAHPPAPIPAARRDVLVGVAAGLVAVAVWAGWIVATRHATATAGLPAEWLAVLRFLPPALVLMPAWLRVGLVPRGVSPWLVAAMAAGSGAPFFMVVATGLAKVPAAEAAVLLPGTMPLCVAVLAALVLRERIGWARASGFGLVAAGVVAIGWTALARGGVGDVAPRLVVLSGALMWAVYTVAFRKSGLGAFAATGLVAAWSTLMALPLALATGVEPLLAAGARTIVTQLLLQGVMSGLVAILAFSLAVRKLGASRAAALSSLTLAAAALLAVPVLGEIPDAPTLAGIAVTLAGVVLASGVLARRR